jgi:hypothetical protein
MFSILLEGTGASESSAGSFLFVCTGCSGQAEFAAFGAGLVEKRPPLRLHLSARALEFPDG